MGEANKTSADKPLVISVRVIEKETSEEFVRYLSGIRNDSKKNLSPIALELMYEGYKSLMNSRDDKILLNLPNRVSEKQKEWLKFDLSIAFLSNVIAKVIDRVTVQNEQLDIDQVITDEVHNNRVIGTKKKIKSVSASEQVHENAESLSPSNYESKLDTINQTESSQNKIKQDYLLDTENQDDEILSFAQSFNNTYAD